MAWIPSRTHTKSRWRPFLSGALAVGAPLDNPAASLYQGLDGIAGRFYGGVLPNCPGNRDPLAAVTGKDGLTFHDDRIKPRGRGRAK